MERNEKQQISVKTINIFNIISYVINGPKGTLHKAAFKNIFIKATCVCKHEIINFMKLDKIWEIWEASEKDMRQNMGFIYGKYRKYGNYGVSGHPIPSKLWLPIIHSSFQLLIDVTSIDSNQ